MMDLAVSNCSDISVRVNTEFDRQLPQVRVGVRSDPKGAETVLNAIEKPFEEPQCRALVKMLNATLVSGDINALNETEPIVFSNLYRHARPLTRSYPRHYYLNDAVTPTEFDTDESKFNSLELRLQGRDSLVFGQQFHWVVSSNTPLDDSFNESVTFWVINETQLSSSRRGESSRVELLASSISSLGSASITGLYIIVLVTVGAYFRSFLVPDVTTIMYVTLPDPLPILELICGLYITRIDTYKWER